MLRSAWALAVLSLSLGCQKQAEPPQAPIVAQSGEVDEVKPEAEPEPPKVPNDAIAVGTFNLEWAFDDLDDRPKKARPYAAKTPEDWAWKRDQIVEILLAEKLDVITLTELGGERELIDIATEVALKDGYEYDTAWLKSSDRATGQQVGILSRFPISNVRRYDVSIDKHVAVDVELPTGEELAIIAVHMRDGKAPAYGSKRRKAARALQRAVSKELEGRPFLITGTLNSVTHPYDDGYAKRTPGILSAKHNRSEDDDCTDSATDAGVTNTAGEPADHIIACGVELRSATTSAEDKVVREDEDPGELPWAAVPVEAEPYRDVSDHYLVWAEIAMPKPPAEESDETEA